MATFSSFTSPKATGKTKEELDDVISNIDPTETPFWSSVRKVGCKTATPEWLTESLEAVNPTPRVEGADIVAGDEIATGVTRKINYVETHYKAVKVTTIGNKVDAAGSRPEMAHQIAMRGIELRRDIEQRLTGAQAAVAGNASTAREMEGFITQVGAGNIDDNGAGGGRALAEASIETVMLALFNNGGSATKMMMKPARKVEFSNLMDAKTNVRRDIGNAHKLVATVTLYESDFGTLSVVPNRFQATEASLDTVLFYDPKHWKIAELHGFIQKDLPADGFYVRKAIGWSGTLIHRNPLASGAILDITV